MILVVKEQINQRGYFFIFHLFARQKMQLSHCEYLSLIKTIYPILKN